MIDSISYEDQLQIIEERGDRQTIILTPNFGANAWIKAANSTMAQAVARSPITPALYPAAIAKFSANTTHPAADRSCQ